MKPVIYIAAYGEFLGKGITVESALKELEGAISANTGDWDEVNQNEIEMYQVARTGMVKTRVEVEWEKE